MPGAAADHRVLHHDAPRADADPPVLGGEHGTEQHPGTGPDAHGAADDGGRRDVGGGVDLGDGAAMLNQHGSSLPAADTSGQTRVIRLPRGEVATVPAGDAEGQVERLAAADRTCPVRRGAGTGRMRGVFSRHVDARVTALSWSRTVVIEQGRWESRRTAWKPHGDTVRNLRTVKTVEPDIVGSGSMRRVGASMPKSRAREVMTEHTSFEYEEFGWHRYRSFSAKGDSTADVHWPEHALEPDQRVSERRETYRARFSVGADGGADEYAAELDEATWRKLRIGRRCRLTVGAFSDGVKQVTPR